MSDCLCELINSGMVDGTDPQVACPRHPRNKSLPKDTTFGLFVARIRYELSRIYGSFERWFRRKHYFHSWSLWRTLASYLVAYPWTRKGCYAHWVLQQERECFVCHEKESRETL